MSPDRISQTASEGREECKAERAFDPGHRAADRFPVALRAAQGHKGGYVARFLLSSKKRITMAPYSVTELAIIALIAFIVISGTARMLKRVFRR
ncbi:hypothetical protein GCM10023184_39840 [Flaviaesturariibacter amylovorans]|uniref:Prepilin-type N-terminal cleavage/methylation domain-containing protein n=1 Tax=Flaviaesturariibacter amylovorans TaxID=1084520 RepID=A0ABP8HMP7_9BACT